MHFHHKKIAVLAANVLTIVFVFLLFSFQGNAEAQNAPDAPMVMGSVAGHVTDDVGLPLAGITVTLYRDSSTFYKNAQTDGFSPSMPVENLPFIEAFAMTGDTDMAIKLTERTIKGQDILCPALVTLWERVSRTQGTTADADIILQTECKP